MEKGIISINSILLLLSSLMKIIHCMYQISDNHRVMKWLKDAKEGIIVAGGNGEGNSLTQLSYPAGVIVDQLGQIYVADQDNHRVMRWCKGAKEGTIVVGGNGGGQTIKSVHYPQGLSFDRQGNLYVADCGIIEYKNLKLINKLK